jgi:hypothetical protein
METRGIWMRGWRGVVLILVGILLGATLITPAVGHVGGSVNHLWGHLRPKADARYVKKADQNKIVRSARTAGVTAVLGTTDSTVNTLTIVAPAAGFVLVQADYNIFGTGCPCEGWFLLRDNVSGQLASNYKIVEHMEDGGYASGSMGWLFPVTAGTRTFDLRGFRGQGTTVSADGAAMQAIYVPYGSTGGSTLSPSGHAPRTATSTR